MERVNHTFADRQAQRRTRKIDAAVEVTAQGGYDVVHMRDIALRAGVSRQTLYNYFPSKVHLLVSALRDEMAAFDDQLDNELDGVTDPFARLRCIVARLISEMEHSDRLTQAMTHAYVTAYAAAIIDAELVHRQTSDMFYDAFQDERNTPRHRQIADLLADAWTSEILALVQGRQTFAAMSLRMDRVIELLTRSTRPRWAAS